MILRATVIFTGWADFPSNMQPHEALRYHPKTMNVIFATAVLLRDVFDLHPARAICSSNYFSATSIDTRHLCLQLLLGDHLNMQLFMQSVIHGHGCAFHAPLKQDLPPKKHLEK